MSLLPNTLDHPPLGALLNHVTLIRAVVCSHLSPGGELHQLDRALSRRDEDRHDGRALACGQLARHPHRHGPLAAAVLHQALVCLNMYDLE